MKFPVSREQLRNIKTDVEDEILQHNIEKAIDFIKGRMISHAYLSKNTKLKIDIPTNFQIIIPNNWYITFHSSADPLASINPWKTHFEVIKEKLTELFPGVTFEIDPLKTYILIDWS